MSFTLTREYVDSLAAASASGDFGPWLAAIDPDVKWRIGGSEDKGAGRAGVYNRDQVVHHFLRHFPEMFPDGIKIETLSTEVIGNKAIVESRVSGETAKAGPYLNYICLVAELSAETGKVVTIREYSDTNKEFGMLAAHGF